MHFCTICEIIFLVGCPWKSNVVLEKSLKSPWKMVAIFCMNPVLKTVTRMLYLGYGLLRYVLIYNLEVYLLLSTWHLYN